MTAQQVKARTGWARRVLSVGLRLLVAGALLGIILLRTDLHAVGQAARQIAPVPALGAVLVMLLVGLVTAAKWLVLLRALQVPVLAREVIRLTYIAVTWNLVLPGGESGNLVKAALLARQQPRLAGAVWASMLVDQISLSAAQLLVALITLSLASYPPQGISLWLTVVGIGLFVVAVLYAAFLLPIAPQRVDRAMRRISRALAVPGWLRRLAGGAEAAKPAPMAELVESELPEHVSGEWLAPLWIGLTHYRGQTHALLLAIGIAALYYGTIFSAYWLASLGLGLPFGYADIAWVTALAGIASLLPITIAGAGVREGIIIFFLTQRGISPAEALAFSLSILALNIVLGLPGLVVQVVRRPVP